MLRFDAVKARKVRFTIRRTNLYEPCIDELEVFDSKGNNIALSSLNVIQSASGSKEEPDRHQLSSSMTESLVIVIAGCAMKKRDG